MAISRKFTKLMPVGQLVCGECNSSLRTNPFRAFCVVAFPDYDNSKHNAAKGKVRKNHEFGRIPKDFCKLHQRNLEQTVAPDDGNPNAHNEDNHRNADTSPESDKFGSLDSEYIEKRQKWKRSTNVITQGIDIGESKKLMTQGIHSRESKNVMTQSINSRESKEVKTVETEQQYQSYIKSVRRLKVPQHSKECDTFGSLFNNGKYYQDEYLTQPYVKEEVDDDAEVEYKTSEEWISVKKYTDNLKMIIKDGKVRVFRMYLILL